MITLTVYYDLDVVGDELYFRDDEIEEIAGARIVSSGCGLQCGARDCQLEFETEEQLNKAKVDLQDAGFRFASFCNH